MSMDGRAPVSLRRAGWVFVIQVKKIVGARLNRVQTMNISSLGVECRELKYWALCKFELCFEEESVHWSENLMIYIGL